MQKSRIETVAGTHRVSHFDLRRWTGPLLIPSPRQGAFGPEFHDNQPNCLPKFFRCGLHILGSGDSHGLARIRQENVYFIQNFIQVVAPCILRVESGIERGREPVRMRSREAV